MYFKTVHSRKLHLLHKENPFFSKILFSKIALLLYLLAQGALYIKFYYCLFLIGNTSKSRIFPIYFNEMANFRDSLPSVKVFDFGLKTTVSDHLLNVVK